MKLISVWTILLSLALSCSSIPSKAKSNLGRDDDGEEEPSISSTLSPELDPDSHDIISTELPTTTNTISTFSSGIKAESSSEEDVSLLGTTISITMAPADFVPIETTSAPVVPNIPVADNPPIPSNPTDSQSQPVQTPSVSDGFPHQNFSESEASDSSSSDEDSYEFKRKEADLSGSGISKKKGKFFEKSPPKLITKSKKLKM